MPDVSQTPPLSADLPAGSFLERRLGAAVWDLAMLALMFVSIVWAFGPHAPGAHPPGMRTTRAVEPRHPWVGGGAPAAPGGLRRRGTAHRSYRRQMAHGIVGAVAATRPRPPGR